MFEDDPLLRLNVYPPAETGDSVMLTVLHLKHKIDR